MRFERRANPPKTTGDFDDTDRFYDDGHRDNCSDRTILEPWARTILSQTARERSATPAGDRQATQGAGVARVYIQYDGCGDSGQIESIEYRDIDGKPIDIREKVAITEDQFLGRFYDFTQARHPGWENNDGAFGDIEWNLTDDTLTHP